MMRYRWDFEFFRILSLVNPLTTNRTDPIEYVKTSLIVKWVYIPPTDRQQTLLPHLTRVSHLSLK